MFLYSTFLFSLTGMIPASLGVLGKDLTVFIRYALSTPARDMRTEALYMLKQVGFLKMIIMNLTLITFTAGEILRAKHARQQRKGKNVMGREDFSVALKSIAKEAAKKAAKEATKELKKMKKK